MSNPNFIEKGYILLARVTVDSTLWQCSPEVLRVAIYLLFEARHQKEPKKFPGFILSRGETLTSYSNISDDCAWFENRMVRKIPRSKVGRIIEKLVEIEFLTRISDTYGTHVKICNYDKYQIPDNYKLDTDGTTVGQQWDNSGTTVGTSKNGNNGKNVKNDIVPQIDKQKNGKRFIPPSLQEVKEYCLERKNGIDPEYFIASNEAKGWVVGKNKTPMKNWQAAIITWERNKKEDTKKESQWR